MALINGILFAKICFETDHWDLHWDESWELKLSKPNSVTLNKPGKSKSISPYGWEGNLNMQWETPWDSEPAFP